MSAKKAAKAPVRRTAGKGSRLLSDVELAAMKETLDERRRARSGDVDGESDVLAKIGEMQEPDRGTAKRLHAIVKTNAPELTPRTWYGMPAYARDGKVICFFQSGQKYKTRYSTFGFQQDAKLDEGEFWPTSFALTKLTPAVEERIRALLKKALS